MNLSSSGICDNGRSSVIVMAIGSRGTAVNFTEGGPNFTVRRGEGR